MNDLTQIGFDYAALPVDAALTARAAAERIKLRLKRTVEDIIEIGRELTAVKDELPHGQFLPWIAAEFEMSEDTATNFMNVCSRFGEIPKFSEFKPSVLYLLAAPKTPETVVAKAVTKAESGEKVTVADVKDWKAELEAERQDRLDAEKRSANWHRQYKEELDLRKQAELSLIEARKKEKIVEKIPEDYEETKQQAAELQAQTATLQAQTTTLQKELDSLQKQQSRLVNEQVKAKLKGYQNEVNEMEQKKAVMQEQVDRMKAYMDSLNSDAKRLEVHQDVIEKSRLALISLAAFLNDLDPITDQPTIHKWVALADMHEEAMKAIRLVFWPLMNRFEGV